MSVGVGESVVVGTGESVGVGESVGDGSSKGTPEVFPSGSGESLTTEAPFTLKVTDDEPSENTGESVEAEDIHYRPQ